MSRCRNRKFNNPCNHPEEAHNVCTWNVIGICNQCGCPQFVTKEMIEEKANG